MAQGKGKFAITTKETVEAFFRGETNSADK